MFWGIAAELSVKADIGRHVGSYSEGEVLRLSAAYAFCVSACHALGMMQLLQLTQLFAASQASYPVCTYPVYNM